MEFEEFAEVVFKEFSRRVYSILRQKVHDDHTAEDLQQEVFLKLFRYKRERLLDLGLRRDSGEDTEEELKALVYGALKDVYAGYYRQLRRREERAADREEIQEKLPASSNPLDRVHASEISAKLLEALSQLTSECRQALFLFYLKDMRYQEVAQALNVELGTVKSKLHRCKRALRELVEQRYPELIVDWPRFIR